MSFLPFAPHDVFFLENLSPHPVKETLFYGDSEVTACGKTRVESTGPQAWLGSVTLMAVLLAAL